MCCSDETISSSRVGARVDLSSPTGNRQTVGNLLFLNPGCPGSSQATHVQFTSGSFSLRYHHHGSDEGDNMITVSIHKSGDLTKPLSESGTCSLLQQFILPLPSVRDRELTATTKLDTPCPLEVGGDGIIGRRVTIHQGRKHLADGIVGFNSAPIPPPPSQSPFTSLETATPLLVAV